jgi:hypothetical protein
MMMKVIKFDCGQCGRYWSYEEFQMHKLRENCRRDSYAANQTELLNKDNQPLSAE